MSKFRRNSYCIAGLIAILAIPHPALFGQLQPELTEIFLKVSPKPSDPLFSKPEAFFDQKATLRVKLVNGGERRSSIHLQWIFLFDQVSTSGQLTRKDLHETIPIELGPGESRMVETKDLRLSGRINKAGQIVGMKYGGCAVLVYENGNLLFEKHEPKDLKKEVAQLLKPPPLTVPGEKIPRENAEPVPIVTKEAEPFQIVLFEIEFSKDEAETILNAANSFSEEDLIRKVGLSKKAAENLVRNRSYRRITDLPKVSYVKKQALQSFKEYALLMISGKPPPEKKRASNVKKTH
jgi:hypothetical protein